MKDSSSPRSLYADSVNSSADLEAQKVELLTVHDSVGAVKTIDGSVKAQDEDPRIIFPTAVVDEVCEDEFGIRLFCHDQEDDGPYQESTNVETSREKLNPGSITRSGQHSCYQGQYEKSTIKQVCHVWLSSNISI